MNFNNTVYDILKWVSTVVLPALATLILAIGQIWNVTAWTVPIGATIAADRSGVTALIASAAKFDHTDFPDGSVLDIALHPSALQGHDGAEVIMSLIRTFFDAGGFYCHFNIFDANTLRNAQATPEKYANLQVRVCGWNTKFVDLSKAMQDAFIAQAEAL